MKLRINQRVVRDIEAALEAAKSLVGDGGYCAVPYGKGEVEPDYTRRLYVESWIIPRLEDALARVTGEKPPHRIDEVTR